MDTNTYWYIAIIAALSLSLVLVFAWYMHLRKKRAQMPSHIQLYFDDNFRKIMTEWDMVTRDRVKTFKKDMNKRLSKVGDDISHLEGKRNDLDSRLSTLDKKFTKLEGS